MKTQKEELMRKISSDAMDIGIENEDKIGYVSIKVKRDFDNYTMEFIEGDFNSEEFIYTSTPNENSMFFEASFYVYIAYYWEIDNTIDRVKQMVLYAGEIPEKLAETIILLQKEGIPFAITEKKGEYILKVKYSDKDKNNGLENPSSIK